MPTEPINYKTYWEKAGLDIHVLIFASADFIVCLDSELDVDWQTTPNYDKTLEKQATAQSTILNQVSSLLSVPVNELTPENKLNFRRMVAEALARCLDQDCSNANSMLKDAEVFVVTRNQEVARTWYLEGAYLSAAFPFICGLLVFLFRSYFGVLLGVPTVQIVLGCSMGGIGALLSVISRVSKIPVDPSAGQCLHYWEALSRILIGMLSALVLQIAIKLNMLLPTFNSYGLTGNLLAGFLAGACEHLVSNFIRSFETTTLRANSKN